MFAGKLASIFCKKWKCKNIYLGYVLIFCVQLLPKYKWQENILFRLYNEFLNVILI
ncbi:hypothetical protein CFter6_1076 [Collimonas fungivorans]|uniref:Uncharacterized protein n=1 Tax=Collimonas fungivorans TaxID=158899 RepID=A0A127P832_9BURK|nr:hypothetical protein CFter6_1076 [Collimonas fungivorans]